MVDLDSKESYAKFADQIKNTGMGKPPFDYFMLTLVQTYALFNYWKSKIVIWIKCLKLKEIHDVNLESFRYLDSNIIGFSLIDYSNVETVKLQSDILRTGDSINKMPTIPVYIFYFYNFKCPLKYKSLKFLHLKGWRSSSNRWIDVF